MDALLQPPTATAFEAVSSIVSAALFLAVAIAAILRVPRDSRARLFLVIALSGVAPYGVSALVWARGPAAFTRPVILAVTLSLAVGSLALFHFMQVFPRRRPWIRAHGLWLAAGYAVLPLLTVGVLALVLPALSVNASSGPDDTIVGSSVFAAIALLAVFLPLIFVLGVVLPFGGLLSLYKSWQEAKREAREGARVTTFWILISQLAGGVLTILVVPLLHLVVRSGPWATIAAALLFGFGLLMPITFALAVWEYRLLDDEPQ